MANYTKGEWKVEHTTLSIVRGIITPEEVEAWVIVSPDGVVAYIPDNGNKIGEANAQLIAKAPPMYAFLKELLRSGLFNDKQSPHTQAWKKEIEQLLAEIEEEK